jgi:DeoR family transcriptional regulator, fructose operon transcriptional repressor
MIFILHFFSFYANYLFMKAAQRQLTIHDIVNSKDFIDIETLGRTLEVSESTLRRDLIELEKKGILKRVHGGVLSHAHREDQLDYRWNSSHFQEEKRRIGKAAADWVEDGQTIILDGGSTVAEVARHLLGRSLQVITNSLPIAQIFANSQSVETTLTGGYLYPRLGVMLGPFCEQMLSNISADLLIMGIGGITGSGLSNSNTLIVGSEKKMIEVSQKVIVVADHHKFGRNAMVHLASLEVADLIVSDPQVPDCFQELLQSHGVELLMA